MAADPEVVEALRRTDLFADVGRRALNSLASEAKVVHHEAGREIMAEGGGALAFHLIRDGQASVRIGDKERPALGPGDYFGDISLIDGKPRSATIRAETPLTTVALSSMSLNIILEKEPEVVRQLLNVMCARLRAAG